MAFLPGVNEQADVDYSSVQLRALERAFYGPDRPVKPPHPRPGVAGPVVVPVVLPDVGPTNPLTDLLTRGFNPKGPPSLLSELINRPPPMSDFERLMQRDYVPRGEPTPTVARTGSLLAALARGSALIGGLLYSSPVGEGSDRPDAETFTRRAEPRGPTRRPKVTGKRARPTTKAPRTEPGGGPQSPLLPDTSRRPLPYPQTLDEPLRVAEPQPLPQPFPAPTGAPQATPFPVGSPLRVSLPDPFSLPLVEPYNRPKPGVRSLRPPRARAIDNPYQVPQTDRPGLTAFQRDTLPSGLTNPARGDCSCPGKSSKPKKKRKPRNECYEGTYRENAKGLLKFRKRKIPCQ